MLWVIQKRVTTFKYMFLKRFYYDKTIIIVIVSNELSNSFKTHFNTWRLFNFNSFRNQRLSSRSFSVLFFVRVHYVHTTTLSTYIFENSCSRFWRRYSKPRLEKNSSLVRNNIKVYLYCTTFVICNDVYISYS